MNVTAFTKILRKYKKCPGCGSSWKETDMSVSLIGEIVTISCKCGFFKQVDENNKEVK